MKKLKVNPNIERNNLVDMWLKGTPKEKNQLYSIALLDNTLTVKELFTQTHINKKFKDIVVAAYVVRWLEEFVKNEKPKKDRKGKKE